jgi:hypothetical protein
MEELQIGELIALSFNAGIVMTVVQVVKILLIPSLREKAPWAIPIIASGLGFASSVVLSSTGIDITPIVGAFSGLAASGMFAVVKEAAG